MSNLAKAATGVPLLALALTYATWAQAGPTDTPLPTFSNGGAAVHVYTAVGVIKNNNLETIFICTNLDTGPRNVGVETFDKNGALANSIDVPPPPVGPCVSPTGGCGGEFLNLAVGATATIGTSGTAVLTEDVTILGLPTLNNGSGRVVATTKKIACTAMLVDEVHAIEDPPSTAPPPTAVDLPLIRVP